MGRPRPGRRRAAGRVRAALSALAEEHRLPVENLLTPDLVRRVTWEPPAPGDAEAVGAALLAGGARPWQVGLTAGVIAAALVAVDPATPGGTAAEPGAGLDDVAREEASNAVDEGTTSD